MKYNVGDVFVDIRSEERRTITVIDTHEDEKGAIIYYSVLIEPDNKENIFSSYYLNYQVDKHVFIHQ
jgi:hypothetical protein